MTEVIRRTTPADAQALTTFTCEFGGWFGVDAEAYIRGIIAARVALGLSAWVVEDNGAILGVAGHEPRPHPSGSGTMVTFLQVLALRDDATESWLTRGIRLSRLMRRLMVDIAETPGREPLCYTLVAADNMRMRNFCQRYGFIFGPVPSDSRYLFYTTRLAAPTAE